MRPTLHNLLSAIPPFPGKLRLIDMLGSAACEIGDGHGSFSSWRGTKFEVDLHDRIQRQMWAGSFEPHVHKCLTSLLKSGDVFFDIGAHVGYHTAAAAQLVGPQGRVLAFEADPVVYLKLTRNVAKLPWVQAFHTAVWDESCALVFERSSFEGESGWGTVTSVRDLGKGEHVSLAALAVDDCVTRCSVDAVHLMKIDAEGSEVRILAGARRTIQKLRPVLILEINDILLRQARTSALELATHSALEGYTLFGLAWLRVQRLAHGEVAEEVLCVPNDQVDAMLSRLQRQGFRLCSV